MGSNPIRRHLNGHLSPSLRPFHRMNPQEPGDRAHQSKTSNMLQANGHHFRRKSQISYSNSTEATEGDAADVFLLPSNQPDDPDSSNSPRHDHHSLENSEYNHKSLTSEGSDNGHFLNFSSSNDDVSRSNGGVSPYFDRSERIASPEKVTPRTGSATSNSIPNTPVRNSPYHNARCNPNNTRRDGLNLMQSKRYYVKE